MINFWPTISKNKVWCPRKCVAIITVLKILRDVSWKLIYYSLNSFLFWPCNVNFKYSVFHQVNDSSVEITGQYLENLSACHAVDGYFRWHSLFYSNIFQLRAVHKCSDQLTIMCELKSLNSCLLFCYDWLMIMCPDWSLNVFCVVICQYLFLCPDWSVPVSVQWLVIDYLFWLAHCCIFYRPGTSRSGSDVPYRELSVSRADSPES